MFRVFGMVPGMIIGMCLCYPNELVDDGLSLSSQRFARTCCRFLTKRAFAGANC